VSGQHQVGSSQAYTTLPRHQSTYFESYKKRRQKRGTGGKGRQSITLRAQKLEGLGGREQEGRTREWRMADGGWRDNLPCHPWERQPPSPWPPHRIAKYLQNCNHCVPWPVPNHLNGIVTGDPPSPLAPPCSNTAIHYLSSSHQLIVVLVPSRLSPPLWQDSHLMPLFATNISISSAATIRTLSRNTTSKNEQLCSNTVV
jgi:hypothetical protein